MNEELWRTSAIGAAKKLKERGCDMIPRLWQGDLPIYLQCWDYDSFADNLAKRYGETVSFEILKRISTVEHWSGWYKISVQNAVLVNNLVGGTPIDVNRLLTVERRFQGIIDRLGMWVNSPTIWADHEQDIQSSR